MFPLSAKIRLWLCLLFIFALVACSTTSAVTRPAQKQITPISITVVSKADTFLSSLVKKGAFRGSALIAIDGKVLFSKGYGLADWDTKIPNTQHTMFRIASLTKQFTAMAILILQERGALSNVETTDILTIGTTLGRYATS